MDKDKIRQQFRNYRNAIADLEQKLYEANDTPTPPLMYTKTVNIKSASHYSCYVKYRRGIGREGGRGLKITSITVDRRRVLPNNARQE